MRRSFSMVVRSSKLGRLPHVRADNAGHVQGLNYLGSRVPAPACPSRAQIVDPDKRVMRITGDGAMGFHIQEFDTMVRHRLPICTVVLNNQIWGMSIHESADHIRRELRAISELSGTNYASIAAAFGCRMASRSRISRRSRTRDRPRLCIRQALLHRNCSRSGRGASGHHCRTRHDQRRGSGDHDPHTTKISIELRLDAAYNRSIRGWKPSAKAAVFERTGECLVIRDVERQCSVTMSSCWGWHLPAFAVPTCMLPRRQCSASGYRHGHGSPARLSSQPHRLADRRACRRQPALDLRCLRKKRWQVSQRARPCLCNSCFSWDSNRKYRAHIPNMFASVLPRQSTPAQQRQPARRGPDEPLAVAVTP